MPWHGSVVDGLAVRSQAAGHGLARTAAQRAGARARRWRAASVGVTVTEGRHETGDGSDGATRSTPVGQARRAGTRQVFTARARGGSIAPHGLDLLLPDGDPEDPRSSPCCTSCGGRSAPSPSRSSRTDGDDGGVQGPAPAAAPRPAGRAAARTREPGRRLRHARVRTTLRPPAPGRRAERRRDRGGLDSADVPAPSPSCPTARSPASSRRAASASSPWDEALVQPASVDLRLGDSFRVFHNHRASAIDLRDPPVNLTEEVKVEPDEPFVIHPGEFALGRTLEWVELPDDIVARIEGKSIARAPRAHRPRHRGVLRPGLARDAHARARQPDAHPDQALPRPADRPALLHDPRRPGAAALRPRAARQPLPGPGGGHREPLREPSPGAGEPAGSR